MRQVLTLALGALFFNDFALGAERHLVPPGFYSGGKFQPVEVEPDAVIVRRQVDGPNVETPSEGQRGDRCCVQGQSLRWLHSNGMDVLRRQAAFVQPLRTRVASAGKKVDELGVPVWFDKERTAFGILGTEVLVRLRRGAAKGVLSGQQGILSVTTEDKRRRIFRLRFRTPQMALTGANGLFKSGKALYAHPNFMVPKVWRSSAPPSDPYFSKQWHLENSREQGGTRGEGVPSPTG
ncbi:hypothetical protein E3A20_26960, partial [Planctomyces bekefii]